MIQPTSTHPLIYLSAIAYTVYAQLHIYVLGGVFPLGESLRDADDAVSLGTIERRLVNRPVTGAGCGLLRPRNPFQRQPHACRPHRANTGHTPATGHHQTQTQTQTDTTGQRAREADQTRARASTDQPLLTTTTTPLPTPPTSAHTPRHQAIDDPPLYKPPPP